MKITFYPQRRDDELTLFLQGENLTVSGDILDLSTIPDGATVPMDAIDNPFICGPIDRIDGELCVNLLLPRNTPFGVFDEAGRMRQPFEVTVTRDGDIALPIEPKANQEDEANAD